MKKNIFFIIFAPLLLQANSDEPLGAALKRDEDNIVEKQQPLKGCFSTHQCDEYRFVEHRSASTQTGSGLPDRGEEDFSVRATYCCYCPVRVHIAPYLNNISLALHFLNCFGFPRDD